MAAPAYPPYPPYFPGPEPWTEERFLALPDDLRTIELLDGSLLVSPLPGTRHQRLLARLHAVLDAARPDGLEVLPPVNVRLAPERIVGPDLVVVTTGPGVDPDVVVWDARDVRMVVEIDGGDRRLFAERIKPALYAAAGIPHLLRVDLTPDGPDATAYDLHDGEWASVARAAPGSELVLERPFPVTVDLTALLRASRPPS